MLTTLVKSTFGFVLVESVDSAYWGSVQLEQLELIRYDHIERERATSIIQLVNEHSYFFKVFIFLKNYNYTIQ